MISASGSESNGAAARTGGSVTDWDMLESGKLEVTEQAGGGDQRGEDT